jgi:Zn-dependent M28 family amino/carboxypeptidase
MNPRWRSMAAKLSNAEEHGAAGVLFLSNRVSAETGDDLLVFSMTAPDASPAKLPAFHVLRSVAADMLQGSASGRLGEREAAIDAELKPHSSLVDGWSVSLDIDVEKGITTQNVVGVLEGTGPLANETVIVGAHYDHLGYGGSGSFLPLTKPAIHHGADDNGSGTTTVIELARRFGKMPARAGRRLVFITFSGEERGLLGSAYYCKEPLFPLDQTVAMVNLDMVGRLRPDPESKKGRLLVYGAGSAKVLDQLVDRLARTFHFQFVRKHDRLFSASDHFSFYAKQIPVLFFFTDDHSDYHRPTDTADKINYQGMQAIADMVQQLLTELRTTPERPEYVKLANFSSGYRGGRRLGIRPSYGDDQEGVLLEGVVEAGPAAKAGLKEGDRIVEIGGKPIKSIEAYMTILAELKQGEAVEVGILRQGKKLAIKVMPE